MERRVEPGFVDGWQSDIRGLYTALYASDRELPLTLIAHSAVVSLAQGTIEDSPFTWPGSCPLIPTKITAELEWQATLAWQAEGYGFSPYPAIPWKHSLQRLQVKGGAFKCFGIKVAIQEHHRFERHLLC